MNRKNTLHKNKVSKPGNKRFPLKSSILTAGFIAALGISLTEIAVYYDRESQQEIISDILPVQAAELERMVSTASLSTQIVSESIVSNEGSAADIAQLAGSVVAQIDEISSLRIAPLGIVSDTLQGDGGTLRSGENLLLDQRYARDAVRAIESESISLSGPHQTSAERKSVLIINPVFIQRESGNHFWGFVSSQLHLDNLLKGLQQFSDSGFTYRISRRGADYRESVFWANTSPGAGNFEYERVELPDGIWSIGLSSNPLHHQLYRATGYALALLAALLCGYLVYRLAREPYQTNELLGMQTQDLRKLAYVDNLTRLPNLKYFARYLQKTMQPYNEDDCDRMVVIIDIKTWSDVVDTIGYRFANEIIKSIASRLDRKRLGAKLVSRCADGIFLLLFEQRKCAESAPSKHIDKLQGILAEPFSVEGAEILLNVSIGFAAVKKSDNSATRVIMRAERSLGMARPYKLDYSITAGKSLSTPAPASSDLVVDLSHAIQNNELEIVYQPIVCARTGAISKAEALLRWNHPVKGSISPTRFIPIAEKTGLIHEIGDWVFKQVALASLHWRNTCHPDFQISINVSPEQLNKTFYIDKWSDFLQSNGISGKGLLIELTEGVLLAENKILDAQLERFRSMGIALALDDFGTGYSSLFYLKRLNIEYLKIDRSFIRNLSADNKDRILCKSILSIALKLNVKVVAEGVENEFQREFLCKEGCDYLQGYLFSRPVSQVEFEDLTLVDAV